MSSLPPGPPPPAAGFPPGGGPPPPAGPGGAPPPEDPLVSGPKALIEMARQIDEALMALAEAVPGGTGNKFAQCRQLLQQAVAELLEGGGMEGAPESPTSPGSSFPGGGFTSGMQG